MSITKAAKIDRVRREAERARSIKGVHLPEAIIDLLCKLQAERPDLYLQVNSADGLVRKLSFFKKYAETLRFYDQDGQKFNFSGKAKPVMHNQIFIGVSYSEKYKRIRVYAKFPGE